MPVLRQFLQAGIPYTAVPPQQEPLFLDCLTTLALLDNFHSSIGVNLQNNCVLSD